MLVPILENAPAPSGTNIFLEEFGNQLASYADHFYRGYKNATEHFNDAILPKDKFPEAGQNINSDESSRSRSSLRRRRQVMTPDLSSLQSGYSKYFGVNGRRKKQSQRRKDKGKPPDEDMPIVLVPQEDETECVASNQLSSFGFLGFVLNVVNAVINVANNINNNDNSNNDNNNNNNNNDLNTNAAAITQTTTNTNMAMAMAGRRLERLRSMRQELQGNLQAIENHRVKRHRRSSEESKKNHRSSRGSSTEESCSEGEDIVDEALLTAIALLDMWKDVLFEDEPSCMALELCLASWKLSRVSRLAHMMADVAGVAAAQMLKNFQGVNPEYLTHAAAEGLRGANCTKLYSECH